MENSINHPGRDATALDEAPDPGDLKACMAVCCIQCNLYCKFWNCLGGYSKGILLGCVEGETACCKPGEKDGACCTLLKVRPRAVLGVVRS